MGQWYAISLSLCVGISLSLSRSTIRKRNAVGLLVDYPPSRTKRIRKVFITNDLTEPVLKEAIHLESDFIVSYHPTPFRSFKKVVGTDRTARIVLECVANGIAVYSPHTASDAAVGGVNDWLIGGLGESSTCEPVKPFSSELEDEGAGMGRKMKLRTSTDLETIVNRVKKHCNLSKVRVAVAPHRFRYEEDKDESVAVDLSSVKIETVAVCAGSGSTVLRGCEADVYVVFEFSSQSSVLLYHSLVSLHTR